MREQKVDTCQPLNVKSIAPKKKVVAAKKTVKKDNVTDKICVICMDPIKQKNMASLDTCGHKYCVGCIVTLPIHVIFAVYERFAYILNNETEAIDVVPPPPESAISCKILKLSEVS